jgi:hypothetical protein
MCLPEPRLALASPKFLTPAAFREGLATNNSEAASLTMQSGYEMGTSHPPLFNDKLVKAEPTSSLQSMTDQIKTISKENIYNWVSASLNVDSGYLL